MCGRAGGATSAGRKSICLPKRLLWPVADQQWQAWHISPDLWASRCWRVGRPVGCACYRWNCMSCVLRLCRTWWYALPPVPWRVSRTPIGEGPHFEGERYFSRALRSRHLSRSGCLCHSQSLKTINLRNALKGFMTLCKLTFGTTKNPLREYQYICLESSSKLPTNVKVPSTYASWRLLLPTLNLVH